MTRGANSRCMASVRWDERRTAHARCSGVGYRAAIRIKARFIHFASWYLCNLDDGKGGARERRQCMPSSWHRVAKHGLRYVCHDAGTHTPLIFRHSPPHSPGR